MIARARSLFTTSKELPNELDIVSSFRYEVFMTARNYTYETVIAALRELAQEGVAITVKGAAKRAGIARTTIYNDAELLGVVKSFEMQGQFHKGFRAGEMSLARSDASEEWARGILYLAPGEAITASLLRQKRTQLSKFFHPDRGGDTELQQTLNQAFDVLKGKTA